jgi:hypothetical protein
MWLLTTFISALIASFFWFIFRKQYSFDKLALMLWGATVMILVDHILGYEGGDFLEKTTDGIITNGITLGIVMLIPVLMIWLVFILLSKSSRRV